MPDKEKLLKIAGEIRRFGQGGEFHYRVRLKSGKNLSEIFTKYIRDDRAEASPFHRQILTELEKEVQELFYEIADNIATEAQK